MKRKGTKTSKGITLIALVITIIVLLILAGVAINMAINSDGLFGKAKEATEKWNTAAEKESTEITDLLEIANNVGGKTGGGDEPVAPTANWDFTKIASTVKETSTITGTNKERIVPIPKGFTASQIGGTTPENTIAGGLVIYQIPEGAEVDWTASTITIGENTTNLQETVNQFVWIPVDDINQMVMCKSNTSGSVCNLDLVDGKLQCVNVEHNDTKEDLCGRLYGTGSTTTDQYMPKTYTTSMNFLDRTQTWEDTGYREPAVLGTSYDNEENTGDLAIFQTNMANDFINMATSVKKYGGFYVSRYESGVNGESKKKQIVITAGETIDEPTVYQGVNMWYGLYNEVHREIIVGTRTMQSHMIYGSQYDQIINFIGSEGQIGHLDKVVTSQSRTGTKETDRLNNIYDLEGNNYECTAQARYTTSRVFRGDNFGMAASRRYVYSASTRNEFIVTNTSSNYATRATLYF